MENIDEIVSIRMAGEEDLHQWISTPVGELAEIACSLRDAGHGGTISYSRKVFIPLTKLCRNVCHYCVFAEPPRPGNDPYLSADEVLAIARAGKLAGCKEALFTLGDKPEARYSTARKHLQALGYETTVDYLAAMCELVFCETGLLPHVNSGTLTASEIQTLKTVSVSQGLMLESTAERLCRKGGVHYGSPDKHPARRLETIRLAGEARVPFTTGILIGIGETRIERIDALLAIRDLHREFGHIQEVIVQNFRAKPGTKLEGAPEPDANELMWTLAVARLIFGPQMSIQAPPNLSFDKFADLIDAGLNDWGGISPVTPDHVNPEAAWPHIDRLAEETARKGKRLVERLASYPSFVRWPDVGDWHNTKFLPTILDLTDATGLARNDDWAPGLARPLNWTSRQDGRQPIASEIRNSVEAACDGHRLAPAQLVRLFEARDEEVHYIAEAANELRAGVVGDEVTYVVNRNINYTNICSFRCSFCAFSKGSTAQSLRGAPYDIGYEEIVRRSREAWDRGATEVCLQGGIHPHYTGRTYLDVCRAIKGAVPDLHVHAFSPLEISQGSQTMGLSLREFLQELKAVGLGSLPGTAAEVLDDEVRRYICPDKLDTSAWLEVVRTAHEVGLQTTSTIMFGHVDSPLNWARHLLAIRDLQMETGGITEFVPLPFVHMEAPMYARGRSRRGPTSREVILMHAVSRLALNPFISNIQASWVKLGVDGLKVALGVGANDIGGTLMNESISRAAGTTHGQELAADTMQEIIRSIGRTPRQRSTLYATVSEERMAASFQAEPLTAPINEAPLRGGRARLASPLEFTETGRSMSEAL